MKGRRPLTDGVGPIDRRTEDAFVYGKPSGSPPTPPADRPTPQPASAGGLGEVKRLPLSTRIRPDYATALKRASLERQLSGVTPKTLQDILEEALGPWLRDNGYID